MVKSKAQIRKSRLRNLVKARKVLARKRRGKRKVRRKRRRKRK